MLMTKEYILDCLNKYCTFSELSEDSFYENIVRPLKEAKCFSDWVDACGVTKGVLIFKGLDFVVKIPFEGQHFTQEEHWEEEENGRWHYYYSRVEHHSATPKNWIFYEEDNYFEAFGGAPEEDGWNYCLGEALVCEKASEKGLRSCFAETSYLGHAGDHPIYIQERCTIFCDEESSRAETYKNRSKADYDSLKEVRDRVDFYDCDDNWLLDFLIYWGEEMLHDLANFLYDSDINDLHNGNIGYRNGVPVLVDYSGYKD